MCNFAAKWSRKNAGNQDAAKLFGQINKWPQFSATLYFTTYTQLMAGKSCRERTTTTKIMFKHHGMEKVANRLLIQY